MSWNSRQDNKILEITIPSPRTKVFLKYYSVGLSMLFIVLPAIGMYAMVMEGQSILILVPFFLFFVYFSFLYLNEYFWLEKGYEKLMLRKDEQIVLEFFRVGLIKYHKVEVALTKDTYIGLVNEYKYSTGGEARSKHAYGYAGSNLCFDTGKKVTEFGVSLSKEESVALIKQVEDYINRE